MKSENGTLTVSQRNRFFEGDELEIMNRGKAPTVVTVKNLKNALGESVDNAPNPMAEFTFDCDADVPAGAFIRRSTDGKYNRTVKLRVCILSQKTVNDNFINRRR